MKAAVCHRYGPPESVEIKDMPQPVPQDRELLIQVKATTVSSGDCRIRGANFPRGFGPLARLALGWSGPRKPVLGTELSGIVQAVGRDVTRFKVGDHVIAYPGIKAGAHAEYCVMPEDGAVVMKPANLSFSEAAALGFGGLTALYFLRDRAKLQAGEKLLIIGASGAVGVAALQLAKEWGAEITAVASGRNAELLRSLGASHVIDYTQTDFTKSGARYDVILDTVGVVNPETYVELLQKNGRLVPISADLFHILNSLWKPMKDGKKILTGVGSERGVDLQFLTDLAARGHYKAVVDRSFPFAQIAEAHAYVDTGRKRGSVVLTLS
ncbi:MAG TPA: NAD(P)-dependent alcohol dehydrogenase [Oligoflexus sp.]|uniref:NAD(P)-dependent alcohol dehydrogenase n=1 Tax=Oligoflexus sp. TaxID=1971216 RepID=UPI002D7F6A6B|nr:NAD(P)-dependent alcohol dehydrogenase [Oligoflexus sp.]HET9237471.1 NAD(P)-dependent alcohol dehydrogenase [Oligoflexus sp.]